MSKIYLALVLAVISFFTYSTYKGRVWFNSTESEKYMPDQKAHGPAKGHGAHGPGIVFFPHK